MAPSSVPVRALFGCALTLSGCALLSDASPRSAPGPLPRGEQSASRPVTAASVASARTSAPEPVAAPVLPEPSAVATVTPTPSTMPSAPLPEPTSALFARYGANLEPDDDRVVGPPEAVPDCIAALASVGVEAHPVKLPGARPVRLGRGNSYACGAHDPVQVTRVASGVRWTPAPLVSCRMAFGLARLAQLAAEEARRTFGKSLRAIRQMGTYSCRKMARFKLASEHSFANAVDVESFELDDGQSVSVLRDFGKLEGPEPTQPGSRFLRAVARRAFDEQAFSVVLTPYFDALHHNHFHLDLARYRVDGTGR